MKFYYVITLLMISVSAFAQDAVKRLPIAKKKPDGMVHVAYCQPGPALKDGPSLYCKMVEEKKK